MHVYRKNNTRSGLLSGVYQIYMSNLYGLQWTNSSPTKAVEVIKGAMKDHKFDEKQWLVACVKNQHYEEETMECLIANSQWDTLFNINANICTGAVVVTVLSIADSQSVEKRKEARTRVLQSMKTMKP